MQSDNRILSDMARVASGAFAAAAAARDELEQIVQHRLERFLQDRGWVTREEFDAVRDMAIKARTGQEELARRLDELEAEIASRQRQGPGFDTSDLARVLGTSTAAVRHHLRQLDPDRKPGTRYRWETEEELNEIADLIRPRLVAE